MRWTHQYLANKNVFNERLKDSSLHVKLGVPTEPALQQPRVAVTTCPVVTVLTCCAIVVSMTPDPQHSPNITKQSKHPNRPNSAKQPKNSPNITKKNSPSSPKVAKSRVGFLLAKIPKCLYRGTIQRFLFTEAAVYYLKCTHVPHIYYQPSFPIKKLHVLG